VHGKKKNFKMSINRYVIQQQQKKVVLMRKHTTFVVGNNITCVRVINCNYIRVARLYTVETWCVAGVPCVMMINDDDRHHSNGNNTKMSHKIQGL